MNEKGVTALVEAALRGQPQHFGGGGLGYIGPLGELCGLAVLGFHAGISLRDSLDLCAAYDLRHEPRVCTECGAQVPGEARLISHLNDDHRADFLKIARTLGAA